MPCHLCGCRAGPTWCIRGGHATNPAVVPAPSPRAAPPQVLPVFCFDPRFLSASAWGNPKTGPYRAQFLLESVADLKARLRAAGSDLLVALGKPEEVGTYAAAASAAQSAALCSAVMQCAGGSPVLHLMVGWRQGVGGCAAGQRALLLWPALRSLSVQLHSVCIVATRCNL